MTVRLGLCCGTTGDVGRLAGTGVVVALKKWLAVIRAVLIVLNNIV
jgi:hypothetical protein